MTRKEACYYLGIREDAAEEQIKRAYRYKAKLYHPDANPDMDTKEYYIKVQSAYEYLMNNPNNIPPSNAAVNTAANQAMNRNTNMYYNNPFCSAAMNTMYGNPSAANFAGVNAAKKNDSNVNQFGAKTVNVRPAKVYASTATAKASYKKQKEKEKEREKIQKWDAEYKSNKRRQQQTQLYGKEYTDKMTGTSKSKEDEILEKIRAIWLAETIKRQIELDKEHKDVLQRRKLYQAFMQQQVQDDSVKKIFKSAKDTD
ncbi:MAG: DnaJ domain-containing protein [Lachnospiraceae bacterium]|nr:DnaJ domain-containing protein [Lachnospiraceae bacterium]